MPYRQLTRRGTRRLSRLRNHSCLRGHRRGPDDLSQALTALGRAVRDHRRLARLAPSFFDSAVVDREAENRAERRRWLASWEPALARVYGVEPRVPEVPELPPLPSPRIQRQVDCLLAEREMWLAASHAAMQRYQQQQPHAVMSWSRLTRLLKIGLALGQLASGRASPNRVPEKIVYDDHLTDLERAYGSPSATPPQPVTEPPAVPVATADSIVVAPLAPTASPVPVCSAASPPVPAPPAPPRCDAWSRWSRRMRQR